MMCCDSGKFPSFSLEKHKFHTLQLAVEMWRAYRAGTFIVEWHSLPFSIGSHGLQLACWRRQIQQYSCSGNHWFHTSGDPSLAYIAWRTWYLHDTTAFSFSTRTLVLAKIWPVWLKCHFWVASPECQRIHTIAAILVQGFGGHIFSRNWLLKNSSYLRNMHKSPFTTGMLPIHWSILRWEKVFICLTFNCQNLLLPPGKFKKWELRTAF